jgi:hypothetical protein
MPRPLWIALSFLIALAGGVKIGFRTVAASPRTVRDVLAEPQARALVRLAGTVRSVGTNQLTLKDSTGEIRLSTCPAWYRPLSFGARERVGVVGHVAPRQLWRANRPTFVVYRIEGEYGTRVRLRQHDGVPVWNRYRDLPGRRLQWENMRDLASAN